YATLVPLDTNPRKTGSLSGPFISKSSDWTPPPKEEDRKNTTTAWPGAGAAVVSLEAIMSPDMEAQPPMNADRTSKLHRNSERFMVTPFRRGCRHRYRMLLEPGSPGTSQAAGFSRSSRRRI